MFHTALVLERNGHNMLNVEFNLEDALAVRYEEGYEDGLEEGREEGRKKGLEEWLLQVAKEMLLDGDSVEKIARITKPPIDTIKQQRQ
jgi:predicted transposase YdaD